MPKILIAGENAFAIHTFTPQQLAAVEITETRNLSVAKVGKVFEEELSNELLESIKPSIMMLLKQSSTYKQKIDDKSAEMDGYVVTVFRGKSLNGKKNYILQWLGKMPEQALTENPQHLIPQLLQTFKAYYDVKAYHKKSHIHDIIAN